MGDPPVADDRTRSEPGSSSGWSRRHAREHKLFGGKLDKSKLGERGLERLPVRGWHASREGDWRDWAAVDKWARGYRAELELSDKLSGKEDGDDDGKRRAVSR